MARKTSNKPFIYKHDSNKDMPMEKLQFTVTFTLNDMTGEENGQTQLKAFASTLAENLEQHFEQNCDGVSVSNIVVGIEQH